MANLRDNITKLYYADENTCINNLLQNFPLTNEESEQTAKHARKWVDKIRENPSHSQNLTQFLTEYSLSTTEGIALMLLAESVLRIPDSYNIDLLIEEQLTSPHWHEHWGESENWWVNASTLGLLFSSQVLKTEGNPLTEFIKRTSKPIIRQAVKSALQIFGHEFILGEDIAHAKKNINEKYLYSFDMLGEAAWTKADAEKYLQAYHQAIVALEQKESFVFGHPGISVKLSALHPRFEFNKIESLKKELLPDLIELAKAAKNANINLTIDAEEAIRLDITLDLFECLASDPSLSAWNGLGLAVQAYQKRAPAVIDWLIALARKTHRRIPVRLVKGAYWDSEIKFAQERGWEDYPVYTRKQATDVSYLFCAEKLLNANEVIYPQFATHNAYTVAAILIMAKGYKDFEWQRLQGMGMELYSQVLDEIKIPCRVYAPIGKYKVLLPYLTRRLLENGANSSFVHQIADHHIPAENLLLDPVAQLTTFTEKRNPKIPLPRAIFPGRLSAKTIELSDRSVDLSFSPRDCERSPSCDSNEVPDIITQAINAFPAWQSTPVQERAACLQHMADLLEQHMQEFIEIAVEEGKKTLPNAIGEVREAIDFCRYYANVAMDLLDKKTHLPSVTGETNSLMLQGRGAFVCISPWNFPLAIFLGQVTAALVAGNTVIAKPAEQTPLIAAKATELLYQAGIPKSVLHLVQGDGNIGAELVKDPRIAGVVFTGSTDVARTINQTLAQHKGPIVPFIAETGGINAMVVDSTALLEQVIHDVLISAFDSAGQRCSALRILLVQEEVADRLNELLAGSMAELSLDDPSLLSTDIGPVIDNDAFTMLQKHQEWLENNAKLIYQVPRNDIRNEKNSALKIPFLFPPCAYELESINDIKKEFFGPILHVLRYKTNELPELLTELNKKGFGLTFGIHTRLFKEAEKIAEQMPIGNIYINRTMIGAVVGSQPFGGQGLSGTGPKAGGPHYLLRFITEKVITTNTTAAGGNAILLNTESS